MVIVRYVKWGLILALALTVVALTYAAVAVFDAPTCGYYAR